MVEGNNTITPYGCYMTLFKKYDKRRSDKHADTSRISLTLPLPPLPPPSLPTPLLPHFPSPCLYPSLFLSLPLLSPSPFSSPPSFSSSLRPSTCPFPPSSLSHARARTHTHMPERTLMRIKRNSKETAIHKTHLQATSKPLQGVVQPTRTQTLYCGLAPGTLQHTPHSMPFVRRSHTSCGTVPTLRPSHTLTIIPLMLILL